MAFIAADFQRPLRINEMTFTRIAKLPAESHLKISLIPVLYCRFERRVHYFNVWSQRLLRKNTGIV